MKKPIKFYVVGALLLAPVFGIVASQVFAQTPPSGGRSDWSGQPTPGFFGPAGNLSGQFGRYQLVTNSDGRNYIFDTATGKCWVQVINATPWRDNTPEELKNVK